MTLTSIALYFFTILLLGQAATACLVAGGRLTEAASRLLAFWDEPSARQINRTTEQSHRANTMICPVLTTHATLPGGSLFLIWIWALLSGQSPQPGIALSLVSTPLATALFALIMLLIALMAVALGPRRRLGAMVRYSISRGAGLSVLAAAAALLLLGDPEVMAALSLVFLGSAFLSAIMITLHGFAVYGVFGLIWLPFALVAAAFRIAMIAMAGPFTMALPRWLSGYPPASPFQLSYRRQQQIMSGSASLPRCTSADTIAGAVRPA